MKPLVSIVLPIYNVAEYLPACLGSLLNQTFKDFEIIAVNDGTDDNSIDILEHYANNDRRIKIIHQKNQGLASARNTGFINSRGKFIYFMDSDDLLDPNAILECMNFAMVNNCEIVTFEHKEISDNLSPEYRSNIQLLDKQLLNGEQLLQHLISIQRRNWIPIWMYFFSRDFLEKSGLQFKEGGINHEDILFVPQIILKALNIGYLDCDYYLYRQRPNSITSCRNSFRKIDHFIIANELYDVALKEYSLPKRVLLLKYVASRYDYIISQIKSFNSRNLKEELNEVKRDLKNKRKLKKYLSNDIYEELMRPFGLIWIKRYWDVVTKWPRLIIKYKILAK